MIKVAVGDSKLITLNEFFICNVLKYLFIYRFFFEVIIEAEVFF